MATLAQNSGNSEDFKIVLIVFVPVPVHRLIALPFVWYLAIIINPNRKSVLKRVF